MKIKLSLVVKYVFLIILISCSVLIVSTIILGHKSQEISYNDSEQIVEYLSNNYVDHIKTDIDRQYANLQILSYMLELDRATNDSFVKHTLQNKLQNDSNYISADCLYKLSAINPNLQSSYNTIHYNLTSTSDDIIFTKDSLDIMSGNANILYLKAQDENINVVEEPYWLSVGDGLSDKVFKSKFVVPIRKNGNCIGSVSIDNNMLRYKLMMDSLNNVQGLKAMLLSNEGVLISHSNSTYIGLNIEQLHPKLVSNSDLISKIQNKVDTSFNFKVDGSDYTELYVLKPFDIEGTNKTWALLVSIPIEMVKIINNQIINKVYTIEIIGLIILLIILLVFFFNIKTSVHNVIAVIKQLANGNIHNVKHLKVKGKDEIADMSESANSIIDHMKFLTSFAENIGEGVFDYDTNKITEHDDLGMAVVDVRNSLVKANEEEQKQKEKEEHLNWASQGVNVFNKVLRIDNTNLESLCFDIIETLIKYLNAQMGGIFLKEQESENYKLISSVGFGKEKYQNNLIKPGEGVIGRCILEKDTIFINDVPDDFAKISSGLGKTKPKIILIVPLIDDNLEMIGVLEVESLKPIDAYQIEFVEKISKAIASTIITVRTNVNTNTLLQTSRTQAEELEQQEEEMRQNMEEMQATQEDSEKREKILHNIITKFGNIFPVAEYDTRAICLSMNDKFLDIIGVPKDKIIGEKHRASVFMNDEEQKAYNELWQNMANGRLDIREQKYKVGKSICWLREYFIPIKDEKEQVSKILRLGLDITKKKKAELEQRKIQMGGVNISGKVVKNTINTDVDLQLIDLSYLNMVYKKDGSKIYDILKLYRDTITSQFKEIQQLNANKEFENIKSYISSLKTKISAMGLKNIYDYIKSLEDSIDNNTNLDNSTELIEKINTEWELVVKELNLLLSKDSKK